MSGKNFYEQSINDSTVSKSQTASSKRQGTSPAASQVLTLRAPALVGTTQSHPLQVLAPSTLIRSTEMHQRDSLFPPASRTSLTEQHASESSRGIGLVSQSPNLSPTFLVVPAAKISVALERLLVDQHGVLDVPSNTESVGWWRKKRKDSPIVMAGHLDSKTGPAVFYQVQDLRFGDHILLWFEDGSNTSYTVRQVERVHKDEFPSQRVYNAGRREIRLVTCGGKFNKRTGHYEDNIVVFATPDSA
jgi:hypothetical protein